MKLVTFNIRCDFGQDGENNFEYRKDLILKKIAQEKPDMICFQEVLPHIAKWLKENLTEYYVIGCGRSPELRDEQVSIAYRKDRLNLMEMQSYWLSETPYVPASRYAEQSICPRICNEALFEDLETGKVFRIVNTHLDHIGAQSEAFRLFRNVFCDFHHVTAHNDRQLIVRALFINRQLNLRKIDDMQIDRSAVTRYQLCKIYNLLLCALAGVRRRMEINCVDLDASFCNHKSGNRRIDTAG